MQLNEDNELLELLESYIEKLKNQSLKVEEKINLIEFYVNDHNNFIEQKQTIQNMSNTFSESQISQYLALGLIFSLSLSLEN